VTGLTPYQTVGPFFDFALTVPGAETVAAASADGSRIAIEGAVLDGAGQPVPDALIEIWQADGSGKYAQPLDARNGPGDAGIQGFGRSGTDGEGRFIFETVRPGRVSGPGGLQAPHLVMGVLARGVMTRLVTRLYFGGEPSNDADPILRLVPEDRRATLVARHVADNRYQFNIVLQGEGETVFFDV
jgi:protocatechuate 3,4-dioxygenase alpha subunit